MNKVLITTSGIGSRLGEFTKFTNKTLIRVDDKPALSHIIESYTEDTNFVITLGHFGEHVKQFLQIAYPKRKFEFVWVDKFEGEGSSLLYSMLQAREALQCPFIFHTSDTIVKGNGIYMFGQEMDFENNWIAGIKSDDHSAYSSFDVFGDKVIKMHHKGEANTDYTHIGLIGIKDYELFWGIANGIYMTQSDVKELGDVDVLKQMVQKNDFKFINNIKWYDIGNIDKLNKTREHFKKSFHVLDKLGESIFVVEGNVIKFFADKEICMNRVKRTDYLNHTIPFVSGHNEFFYKYAYVQGDLYSEVANKGNFENFLDWAYVSLWNVEQKFIGTSWDVCFNFYYNKTIKRIQEFLKKQNIEDSSDIINGETTLNFMSLLSKINWNFLCSSQPSLFHGDFILDNIIKTNAEKFSEAYKLLDWRQDFGGSLHYGDKFYDLAKLSHNLVINHAIIDDNLFKIKKTEKGIELNIHRLQTLVDCEEILFNKIANEQDGGSTQNKPYTDKYSDVAKVKILRSIIWLNMSPLHHHPFDLFLFYYGKYTLQQTLNEIENGEL